LAPVSQKLAELEVAIKIELARTRKRRGSMLALCAAGTLFLAGYLGYAYQRFGAEVTPDLVATNAQAVFEQNLPAIKDQLAGSLKDNAPQFVSMAFSSASQLPAQFADQLNSQTEEQLNAVTPRIEDELTDSLQTAIRQSAQTGTGSDEQRFQATLTALAAVYGNETIKFVDQTHATYANQATSFIGQFDKLASNSHLSPQEQLHRDMITSVLALVKSYQDEPTSQNLTTTIFEPAQ